MSDLTELSQRTLDFARAQGTTHAVVHLKRSREVELRQREGKLEGVQEASSSRLSLALYVEGRYSTHSTSDLRWSALQDLIRDAIPMTRLLQEDPHRVITPQALHPGGAQPDLDLVDPGAASRSPDWRRQQVAALEEAAWGQDRSQINAVSAQLSDSQWEEVHAWSSGFIGQAQGTYLGMSAEVSVKDPDGRRPSGWSAHGALHAQDVWSPQRIGEDARRRALSRLGQKTRGSGATTLVIDNRVARRLLSYLLTPLYGQAIQQERSCFRDSLGQAIAHPLLTVIDDPLVTRGLGSRHFDEDGIAARRRALIQGGVLKEQLFDVYTAHKMGRAPNGGSTSNVLLEPGQRSPQDLIGDLKEGIFVTGFLGGNADPNTGDFSHGIKGFAIENGQLTEPLGELNITGNHTRLWKRLVAVGDDPWLASSMRTPTLVFEGVHVSGR